MIKQKEFILSAAIWLNDGIEHTEQPINIKTGYVICGRRHNNCYASIKAITGKSVNDSIGELIKSLSSEDLKNHQGFITSTDRYVNRKEAYIIAKENNQLIYGLTNNIDEQILISEHLY